MTQKSPSMMWYLVPLLFAIIGGVIGYYAIVGRNKSMAKNLLIVGIAMSVILLFRGILI